MKQYEYKVTYDTENHLNEFGKEGYRFVGVSTIRDGSGNKVILMREVEKDTEKPHKKKCIGMGICSCGMY